MKQNKYTYIVKFDDLHHVIFNGVNKKFIIITNDKVHSYQTILDNPDAYFQSHPKVIQQLKNLGVLIENYEDSREALIENRNNFINSPEYKTTILPTFECNYSCWYCTQKHTPVKIDYSKFDLIIKHIQKYLLQNNIKTYVLSWFGGEPLTQPKVIEYVSSRLLKFCEENDIEYSSGITSNGALLTEDIIKMLMSYKINHYQIALDGDEEAHNRIKYDENSRSSFALILNNISNLLRINKDAVLTLRLNYTLPMLRSRKLVTEISRYISHDHRNRLTVDLQKVWQINELSIPIKDLCNLQKELVENGFLLNTDHVFSMCYVEKRHYNMFYYNGGVEKCDKRPINALRGYIDSEGDIVWKESPTFQNYSLFSEDCICNDCKYYPVCYNGCPILREERIQEYGKVVCGHGDNAELHESRIRDYCWRIINNARLKKDL